MHALEGVEAPDIGARDLRGANGAALAGALQRARARGTGGGRAHRAAADMLRRAEERRRRRRADLSRRPSPHVPLSYWGGSSLIMSLPRFAPDGPAPSLRHGR